MAAQQSTLLSHTHHSAALGCMLLLVKEANVPPGIWWKGKSRHTNKHALILHCTGKCSVQRSLQQQRKHQQPLRIHSTAHAAQKHDRACPCLLTYAGRLLLHKVIPLLKTATTRACAQITGVNNGTAGPLSDHAPTHTQSLYVPMYSPCRHTPGCATHCTAALHGLLSTA
jgi:hypothetical protein